MVFNSLFQNVLFCKKNFVSILIFAFNIFYMVVDTNLISPFKVLLMCVCPFILIKQIAFISKPLILACIYLLCVTSFSLMHPESFRSSTIVYLAMFVVMYLTFYTIIWQDIFKIEYFLIILKTLVVLYVVFFIFQQFFLLIGIRYFPLLNLSGEPYLEVFNTNSLSLEPSHTARILCVTFYTWMKLNEYKRGCKITVSYLWYNHRYFFLAFLYIMLAMGSGTAIIALFLLALYFVNRKILVIIPLILTSVITLNEYINFEPLNRSIKVFTALNSANAEQIQKADGSAYYRIAPIVNTIQDSDIFSSAFWFGRGIDSAKKNGTDLDKVMIGGISDYGFISFIFLLLFVYTSAIRRIFCLETLFFIILMACTLGNTYYIWGIMLLFTIIKRFEKYTYE